jgi:hypothetical protein
VGDLVTCQGPPDTIIAGEKSVLIGGQPAARWGDGTAHGGVLVAGLPSVQIGVCAQCKCMAEAAANAAAFVRPAPGMAQQIVADASAVMSAAQAVSQVQGMVASVKGLFASKKSK